MKTSAAPVLTPKSLPEALAMRASNPTAMPIAGGTDVMVFLEAGQIDPPGFLDLWGLPELGGVTPERIGAGATWTQVARCEGLPRALRDCALTVGAAQIQNRGTVGGNIVNASPAGDSLPLWLALDAELEVASTRGARRIPADRFWTAYRKTALAPDELLVAVHIPPVRGEVAYRKVGTRLAQAISKVVLGARIVVEGGVVTEARVALGSVAPVPVRCARVEAALVGKPVDPSAADLVGDDIAPIDDIRSTAAYRRRVAANVIRSWLAGV
ncbi:MAG: FAD binding domain-containing protein [Myxococcota bacterium]